MLSGHVGDDEVLLVRQGGTVHAIGAHCTHYHGPLAEGLVVGDTIRCPWHHACFDLQTGEALAAPALSPGRPAGMSRSATERSSSARKKTSRPRQRPAGSTSDRFVIVGGGAAGFAAAEMLRRRGFAGTITMLQ